MCDIWKGNQHLEQLSLEDIKPILIALKKFNTRQVLLSGGEALLHPQFFAICQMLQREGLYVTLLSTGLTLKKHASQLVNSVDELIISLDGDESLHNEIRNIPGAFEKLKLGIESIKQIAPHFPISGRTVIHRLNFRHWPAIIEAAKQIGLDKISFLPADISSEAFNREVLWNAARQSEICIDEPELLELSNIIDAICGQYQQEIHDHFIAESESKLRHIYSYYGALHGKNDFPYKRCNAPWVSTVIEPDGKVRPCFFHAPIGNIHDNSLAEILNGSKALQFRRSLNMDTNETCKKCVCYLNLSPKTNPAAHS